MTLIAGSGSGYVMTWQVGSRSEMNSFGSVTLVFPVVQRKVRERQEEVEKLVLERNSLLHTLNYLQEELFKSGKKN